MLRKYTTSAIGKDDLLWYLTCRNCKNLFNDELIDYGSCKIGERPKWINRQEVCSKFERI